MHSTFSSQHTEVVRWTTVRIATPKRPQHPRVCICLRAKSRSSHLVRKLISRQTLALSLARSHITSSSSHPGRCVGRSQLGSQCGGCGRRGGHGRHKGHGCKGRRGCGGRSHLVRKPISHSLALSLTHYLLTIHSWHFNVPTRNALTPCDLIRCGLTWSVKTDSKGRQLM